MCACVKGLFHKKYARSIFDVLMLVNVVNSNKAACNDH